MKTALFSLLIMAIASMPSLAAINPGSTKLNTVQLPFIENQGQLDKEILYYTTTRNGTLFINTAGHEYLVLRLKDDKSRLVISEQFVGAKNTKPVGLNPAKTRINRYIGNDPDKWQENIPTWNQIGIKDVYPGIDYQLRPLAQGAEKIFIVKPGADPGFIKLQLEGIDKLSLDKKGSLILHSEVGNVEYTAPIAYQEIDGKRSQVDVTYSLKDKTYGFKIGAYDKTHNLYIDPLVSVTYYGGSDQDYGYSIAVNQDSGSVYITGYTASIDLPTTTGAFQETKPGAEYDRDIYIAKFDAELSVLEAATYYGDTSWQYSVGDITTHPNGSIYITGKTAGATLPGMANGYQPTNAGGTSDAFVVRFDADLSGPPLGTYFGGTKEDVGISITVNNIPSHDLYGYVYIAGRTLSEDLPGTAGGVQEIIGGTVYYDAFVAYFDPNLETLGQSTYYGAALFDEPAIEARGKAIGIDPLSGDLVLVGTTNSPSLPGISGGNHGSYDVFYVQLSSQLDTVHYGEFFGGIGEDIASSMAIHRKDINLYIYITGRTKSTSGLVTPTTIGYQTSYQGGNYDAFILRHDHGLLVDSTYLGSPGDDRGHGITINQETGSVWVTGETNSDAFPTSLDADQAIHAGYREVFVANLPLDLSSLKYSSYLGGSSDDYSTAIALNQATNQVYVTGNTASTDLYGVDGLSYDNTYNEFGDAFVALFGDPVLASWFKDPVSFPGSNPDLAVDSANNLYACYFNGNNAYVVKHDVATGDWSTLRTFPLPTGDLGFSDCSIAVEDGGSTHTCIVTNGPTNLNQPANAIWYLGTGIQEAVDIGESPYDGATGKCDIAISYGMPTISYTKYNTEDSGGCPNCKALAVAVKPSIATGWIVMDDIRTYENVTYWSDATDFGLSTSVAFDSTGLPLVAFTDIDGTASFYIPSDYPPLIPTSLPTWSRKPSSISGKFLNLHFRTNDPYAWMFESKTNHAIPMVALTNGQLAGRPITLEFSQSGVIDSTSKYNFVTTISNDQNDGAMYYIDLIGSMDIDPVFSITYDVLLVHTTEEIGKGLNNCALAKNPTGNPHTLCEDGNGSLVYYKQIYPTEGFLSVSPRNWKFGIEWWEESTNEEDSKEWRAFYLTNLGESPLTIRDVRIESDGDVTPWVLDLTCASNFALNIDYLPGEHTAVCVRPDPAAYVFDTITARLVVETDDQTVVSYLEASPVIGEDTDSDGIPDQEEYGPDGDNPLFDGNGDGIPDSQQSNAVSFASNVLDDGTIAGYITLSSAFEEHSFHNVGDVDSSVAFPIYSTGLAPWGAFTFELELYCMISPPCSTQVQIDFHQSALGLDVFPDSYWKSGPTLPDGDHATYLFHFDATGTGATFYPSDNKIMLYFTDGQRGDHDLIINNQISDPGLPTVSYVDVLGALKQEVLAAALPANLERTLVRYLDQSIKAIEANKTSSAARVTRSLNKLVAAVQEEAGLAIPQETADKWINIAQMMIDQLNPPVAANQ